MKRDSYYSCESNNCAPADHHIPNAVFQELENWRLEHGDGANGVDYLIVHRDCVAGRTVTKAVGEFRVVEGVLEVAHA